MAVKSITPTKEHWDSVYHIIEAEITRITREDIEAEKIAKQNDNQTKGA